MDEQASLQAAIHEDVHLHAYDLAWPNVFSLERARLLSLFPDTFADIQHIGSTAIPGFAAKPIIDILAGVDSIETAHALAEPLCQNGYTTSAAFNATLTDRQWFMRWADGHRTHHLHVVVHGATPWNDHLGFRDVLRKSSDIAARYAALKSTLAHQYVNDREAYTEAKAAFVRSVLMGGHSQGK